LVLSGKVAHRMKCDPFCSVTNSLSLIHALYPAIAVYPFPARGGVKGYLQPITSFITENRAIINSNCHRLLGGCPILLISHNTCKFISLTVGLLSLQTAALSQEIWSKPHFIL